MDVMVYEKSIVFNENSVFDLKVIVEITLTRATAFFDGPLSLPKVYYSVASPNYALTHL